VAHILHPTPSSAHGRQTCRHRPYLPRVMLRTQCHCLLMMASVAANCERYAFPGILLVCETHNENFGCVVKLLQSEWSNYRLQR